MWFFKLVPLIYTRVIFLNKALLARQVNTYSGEKFELYLKYPARKHAKINPIKKPIVGPTK